MKICLFCGNETSDTASSCPSCGAGQFKTKCNNCGTVFEEGMYCPSCGVKAGEVAMTCPDCGYIPSAKQTNESAAPDFDPSVLLRYIPPMPAKKRRTWLWVLGWIFCYPIPLTILLFRGIRYLYREYKRS